MSDRADLLRFSRTVHGIIRSDLVVFHSLNPLLELDHTATQRPHDAGKSVTEKKKDDDPDNDQFEWTGIPTQ
jgi:hypothetical protein